MRQIQFLLPLILLLASGLCGAVEPIADPEIECLQAIAGRPDLTVLKGKMQIGTSEGPTLEMMANRMKPNKSEKVAISALVTYTETCVKEGGDWRAKNWPPTVNGFFDLYLAAAKATAADLYGGSITYGEFSQRIAAGNAKFKADLAAFADKMRSEQQAKQQAAVQQQQQLAQEADRRQTEKNARDADIQQRNAQLAAQQDQARREAVIQMYRIQQQSQQQAQESLYQQQMNAIRRASPRPSVQTDCYSSGNTTNCTSR